MKKVLVTGGAGFIGSNLVDGLLAKGYGVKVLDNFATGHRHNLSHCENDIELIEGDIRDYEIVEQAVSGVDAILHEAALPSVPRSVKAPNVSNDVNISGMLRLLTSARDAGVKRVVFASSSSVYGDAEVLPKVETMVPNPMSPYAITKLTGEYYLKVFASLYGMETLAIRYFNVFGPRQDPNSQYSGVIAKFMKAALSGSSYTVNGDGLQSRDFTYIDNVVDANMKALEVPSLKGEVVNVSCGGRTNLLEMAEDLNSLVGKDLPIRFGPDRPGDVKHSQADIAKARKLLGYEPKVFFKEGLGKTLEWYREAESC